MGVTPGNYQLQASHSVWDVVKVNAIHTCTYMYVHVGRVLIESIY